MKSFDIGSSYIAIAELCPDGKIAKRLYMPHKGAFDIVVAANSNGERSVFTGSNSFQRGGLHPFSALIALSRQYPGVRHILYVGAGSYFIINMDEAGKYLGHVSNTTCASGTGAFLDLQAHRLGCCIEDLGECALRATVRPSISTRCSVFAKTDLIHLQQEGYTKDEIAAGLCKSLAENIIDSLFKGSPPLGAVLLAGGVFQNKAVFSAFAEALGKTNIICRDPEYALAFGVIYAAEKGELSTGRESFYDLLIDKERMATKSTPLKPKLTAYPDFSRYNNSTDSHRNEIAVYETIYNNCTVPVYMGIDIGSTSTKLCVIDLQQKPVLSIYRKTASDPINAVKLLFSALQRFEQENVVRFDLCGVATTGSGRKMIKEIVAADAEINEITAHAKAATLIDPVVDTILEIGGQDAKFTRLKDGLVTYSVMNYVCAAGTGSFIEEQAEKLGIPIDVFSSAAENRVPPATSDRCTVFMEKDIDLLVAQGVPKEDIAAAVLISVRDNYLNKVVGNTPLGEHIYFQGATARNRSLVAAFEQRLEKPITVSPFCHITGALGAALFAKELGVNKSSFVGLDFSHQRTIIEKEACGLCVNKCGLSIISTGDSKVAWGMKCGREYQESIPKKRHRNVYTLERTRSFVKRKKEYKNGSIYCPDFLANAEKFSFLFHFFDALDIEPVIVHPRKEDYAAGRKKALYEICAPCVVTYGALSRLKDKPVFLPYFLRNHIPEGLAHCHLCPLTQAMPSIARGLLPDTKIISPRVFENMDINRQAREFIKVLRHDFSVTERDVRTALRHAYDISAKERELRYAKGDAFLAQLKDDDLAVVVMGRPYVLYNQRLNHGLIDTLGEYGVKAIPLDHLRPDIGFLREKSPHMYWNFGQTLLSSIRLIGQKRNFFPVCFTCFSCGPDSFILNYFYKEMESLKKPYLVLQFDGHSAATGYLTRIEAALDSFRNHLSSGRQGDLSPHRYAPCEPSEDFKKRTVYIPPMEPDGAELIAASFRRLGHKAEVLNETTTSFREGLRHALGHECSPFHSTLGALIEQVAGRSNGGAAFFMPSGTGPCRFGQYATLQNTILREMGLDVDIISPSGENAYHGMPQEFRKVIFDGIMMNDIFKKILLMTRPYEHNKGEADRVFNEVLADLSTAIAQKKRYVSTFKAGLLRLNDVPVNRAEKKPRVGIVGEIYVRSNPFLNDQLIRSIEALGGEAAISSVCEWIFYTLQSERHEFKMYDNTGFNKSVRLWMKNAYFRCREHYLYGLAKKSFPDIYEPDILDVLKAGERYLPMEFLGEAILTLGRALLFIEKEHVDSIVNASPTFCMPGTLTSYMLKNIEATHRVPVISLFYDKTGRPNMELVPHMELIRTRN